MLVKYMHHGDDLVEHRTREASFGAQCTNHSANSMCHVQHIRTRAPAEVSCAPSAGRRALAVKNHIHKRTHCTAFSIFIT